MRFAWLPLACALVSMSAAADEDGLRDFATDRPNKSSSATTVAQGHFQVESDLFNAGRSAYPEGSTRTLSTILPTIKYGMTRDTDIQVTLPTRVWVRDTFFGYTTHSSGWSDLVVTGKVNLLGNDEGDVQVGLAAYVKLPTGSETISNQRTEFGLYLPVTWKMDEDLSISFQLQLDDLVSDYSYNSRRLNLQSFVQLSYALTDTVVVSAEHYTAHKYGDHAATVQTADFAIAWMAQPNLQFDASIYLPLNRASPDWVAILGVSKRF